VAFSNSLSKTFSFRYPPHCRRFHNMLSFSLFLPLLFLPKMPHLFSSSFFTCTLQSPLSIILPTALQMPSILLLIVRSLPPPFHLRHSLISPSLSLSLSLSLKSKTQHLFTFTFSLISICSNSSSFRQNHLNCSNFDLSPFPVSRHLVNHKNHIFLTNRLLRPAPICSRCTRLDLCNTCSSVTLSNSTVFTITSGPSPNLYQPPLRCSSLFECPTLMLIVRSTSIIVNY
jgi:hypothetical protein